MTRSLTTLAFVLSASLAACEVADEAPDGSDGADAATQTDAAPNAAAAPPGPPPPGGGTDCAPLATAAHPDPVQLVRDYATRDAAGAFLRSSDWLDTALLCPGFVPGYDVITAIRAFDVGTPRGDGDTLRVPVTYQRLAEVSGGELEPEVAEGTETFRLVETEHGWRIVAPPTWWQVDVDTVLARADLDPADRDRLRFLREPGR